MRHTLTIRLASRSLLALALASASLAQAAPPRASALSASGPASAPQAASAPSAAGSSPVVVDDSLFRDLGEMEGVNRLSAQFMKQLLADERMLPFFKDVDQKMFKEQISKQFCNLSGGPCLFNNGNMKKVHSGLDISMKDFNALVEVLQRSMDMESVPYASQTRLLAKLAPMHRDIVNKP